MIQLSMPYDNYEHRNQSIIHGIISLYQTTCYMVENTYNIVVDFLFCFFQCHLGVFFRAHLLPGFFFP